MSVIIHRAITFDPESFEVIGPEFDVNSAFPEDAQSNLSESEKVEVDRLIEEIPDANDPMVINYWRDMGDKKVYLEGWSDICLTGEGFPDIGGGEWTDKIEFMLADASKVLIEKQEEKNRPFIGSGHWPLIEGGFREFPAGTRGWLYGATWGVYTKPWASGNPRRGGIDIRVKAIAEEAAVKAAEMTGSKIFNLEPDHIKRYEELPSNHELLFHFGIEEAGSPGAVLGEAVAKASPCSCFTYKGKDLCWSKGIVGLLTQDQQKVYCVVGKTYKPRPALTERYTRFAEAAEEAHKKIETMPKGMPRLEAWLGAMGEELSKRGIEV